MSSAARRRENLPVPESHPKIYSSGGTLEAHFLRVEGELALLLI